MKLKSGLKVVGHFCHEFFALAFVFLFIFKEAVCNQRVIFQKKFCRPHKQTEKNLDFSINMFAEKNCLKILQGQ